MKGFNIILIICFVLGFLNCKKQIDPAVDVGYDYAPTTIGKYVVYDVDSVVYDDFANDTIQYKYRIKEKLAENITDNEGRSAIKLIRYIKYFNPNMSYDAMNWTIKDVWSYTKTNTTLEVVEEDVRLTKLAFPVAENATWNGNAHNTIGEWNYKYEYVNQAETINGKDFDNVLYVEQKDDKNKNVIHREYYIEKYAKNVGLVYREIKDLTSSTVTVGANGKPTPVETRITAGIIYKLTYVSHGTE